VPHRTVWRHSLALGAPVALVFGVGWLCASALFAVYADLVGAYTPVFGVLGGIVVLLVWFPIIAYALIIGAELNTAVRDLPVSPS
jgi:membrane protein